MGKRLVDDARPAALQPIGKCPVCDEFLDDGVEWEFDHFPVPWSDGGSEVVAMCLQCHTCLDRGGLKHVSDKMMREPMASLVSKIGQDAFVRASSAKTFSEFAAALGIRQRGDWSTVGLSRWERMVAFMANKMRMHERCRAAALHQAAE